MIDKIEAGDFVKIPSQNRVFQVKALTSGERFTPDGWFIDDDGHFINPRYCEKYKGATSVLGGVRS